MDAESGAGQRNDSCGSDPLMGQSRFLAERLISDAFEKRKSENEFSDETLLRAYPLLTQPTPAEDTLLQRIEIVG